MTHTKKTKVKLSEMTQSDQTRALRALLKAQPDILEREPKLLETLNFSDPKEGNITSLAGRQSERLKDELAKNKRRTQELLENAKHYDALTNKIYDLINDLIACRHSDEVVDAIAAKSPHLFSIDFVEIKGTLPLSDSTLLAEYFAEDIAEHPDYQHVMERLAQGKCLCSDRFPPSVLEYFFSDHSSEVKSVAFIPLIGKDHDPKKTLGVLAYGSKDKRKFSSSLKGTVHLERIGKVTALSLERIASEH